MLWSIGLGFLLVVAGALLPWAWAYWAESRDRELKLRFREGDLEVEFVVMDATSVSGAKEPAILSRLIEFQNPDMTNVVMLSNQSSEAPLEDQKTLVLQTLINYFERRLQRAQQ